MCRPGNADSVIFDRWGGSKYGWGDVRIIVLLSLSVLLIGLFALQQWRKGDNATLPPRIIGHRSLISGMWFSLCNNSALSIVDYYVSLSHPELFRPRYDKMQPTNPFRTLTTSRCLSTSRSSKESLLRNLVPFACPQLLVSSFPSSLVDRALL